MSPVVAINAFPQDHDSEHEVIIELARQEGVRVAVSTHVVDGGVGAAALARELMAACEERAGFHFTYGDDVPLADKIEMVARRVYGADGIDLAPAAAKALHAYETLGYGTLPVVIAKSHLSISHDPAMKGADRLAAARPGGAGRGRSRVRVRDLRRHAHDARALAPPKRRADRPRRRCHYRPELTSATGAT